MPDYSAEIVGLDRALAHMRAFPQITEKYMQKAVEASVAEAHKFAEQPLVPQRTRNLIKSFGQGITIGRLFGSIGPRVKYAIFVHEGTKNIKTPNKFMEKIRDKAQDRINKHFKDAMDIIAKVIAKE